MKKVSIFNLFYLDIKMNNLVNMVNRKVKASLYFEYYKH